MPPGFVSTAAVDHIAGAPLRLTGTDFLPLAASCSFGKHISTRAVVIDVSHATCAAPANATAFSAGVRLSQTTDDGTARVTDTQPFTVRCWVLFGRVACRWNV